MLLKFRNRITAVILAGCATAYGQSAAPFGGPVEAFVFDSPTKSIRPVVGALGSASLGEPLANGLDYGSVAPHHRHAVVFGGGRGTVLSSLGSPELDRKDLPEFVATPEGVAWSENGAVAVLYSKTQNWIQIVRGLPLSPTAASQVSISAGSLASVALDPSGDQIFVAISGEVGGVYRAGDSIDLSQSIISVQQPASISLSNDGQALYVLDAAAKQVTRLHLTTLAQESLPVSDLEDPKFIRVGRDAANRNLLYVASARDRVLAIYEMTEQHKVSSIPLEFAPTTIEVLGRNSFLLSTRISTNDLLWCLTGAGVVEPRVHFVPAMPIASQEGQNR